MKLGNIVLKVEVPRFPVVRLTYEDGFVAELNFSEKLSWGEATKPLRDPSFFATAHVGADGSSVEWIGPRGEQIDFCVDALRIEAEARLEQSAAE